MSNMSYCRFENTLRDLRDCKEALDDGALEDEKMDEEYERPAMLKLVSLCREIAEEYPEEDDEDDPDE